MSNTNLTGANREEADLSGADLSGAKLTEADLQRAKIDGAIFCKTKTPWGIDNSGC